MTTLPDKALEDACSAFGAEAHTPGTPRKVRMEAAILAALPYLGEPVGYITKPAIALLSEGIRVETSIWPAPPVDGLPALYLAPPAPAFPDGADLDARMKAAGMIPLSDLLCKESPLDKWATSTAVCDVQSFKDYVERRYREFMTMRVAYELGEKGEEDELYEWVLAHCGALHDVLVNLRAALAIAPEPPSVAIKPMDWSNFDGPKRNTGWMPDIQELIHTALNHLDGKGDADQDAGEQIIERLLSALRSALVDALTPDHSGDVTDMFPAGWKLVPIEPTTEMLDRADDARPLPEQYVRDVWGAMLAAAPQPPAANQLMEQMAEALKPFAEKKIPDTYKTAFVMADDLRRAGAALDAYKASKDINHG